mmetsp:Transcript_36188/g.77171  ORF Transcript_36188/g.77171 Transcript_36188/m.77171 type:complete len:450 (-) Transcript_36188:25-1374(-)|eukprot:CAMPEP_0172556638 /NCGR_PEP_ID=MMETSP1067-20121228/67818_1 /TAXON_ID=265564 ORGANISM="Thalassiosira punctigera, Strain Tpunct2005C2" /NCGR_SAMPLE_ID=MMETSP1067 /ASSEMBLY_ACC=CAM_ASM_000444 /LENGTH=449 /DNA_ID=CAMNT_0013345497 /DNA_START=278 /DNA_END=1627 /DNA_ORIENTATION=+
MAPASNENGRNALPLGSPAMKTLVAKFTKRDLILYALGIGCCDDSNYYKEKDDRELRFVYENHPNFEAFPTFLLALPFIAEHPSDGSQSSFGIRRFPPESMTDGGNNIGILPREFLKNLEDIEGVQNLPILHMSQSLILHDRIKFHTIKMDKGIVNPNGPLIDPPREIELRTRILSIKPRSIGTFVTSQTKYYQDGNCIATAQMVALILGLDPDDIVPLKGATNNLHEDRSRTINQSTKESSFGSNTRTKTNQIECKEKQRVLQVCLPKNAALLYRLSGDYNPIHVEDDLLGPVSHLGEKYQDGLNGNLEDRTKGRGNVLHGLCTMGYALRAILQYANHQMKKKKIEGGDIRLTSVRCNFVKPVYVGDILRVEVWDEKDWISSDKTAFGVCFRVYRGLSRVRDGEKQNSEMVVDIGEARFCLVRPEAKVPQPTCTDNDNDTARIHVARL